MKEKIESLTKEQDDKLEIYYEKWVKIGLHYGVTTNHNRNMANEAVFKIYEQAGLPRPEIIWTRSPNEAIQTAFKMGDKEIKNNPFGSAGFGQHDANWLGFYEFFREELGLREETEELVPMMMLANHCGWWFPYENVCIVSERPTMMLLDTNGNLHSDTGPAIQYSDGFSLYCLHGLAVPDWAILTPKNQIDPKRILQITNTEQRYALMKHVGLTNFLSSLNAEFIHEYNGYKLMYLTVEGQKIGPYLYMKCPSSGREFLEGVGEPTNNNFIDKTIKTCQDALEWRARKASNDLMTKFNLKWEYHA